VTREVVPAAPATGASGLTGASRRPRLALTRPMTSRTPATASGAPCRSPERSGRCPAVGAPAAESSTAPSPGYRQAERQAARLLKKAARQNTHDGRVWAQRVVAGHDVIAVEDFKPKFLAKSDMARKAADSTVGALSGR